MPLTSLKIFEKSFKMTFTIDLHYTYTLLPMIYTIPNFELFDGRGPQILTVPSSDALANMLGTLGFQ